LAVADVDRRLFVVEEARRGQEDWAALSGDTFPASRPAFARASHLSHSEHFEYRVITYVPEDETPKLLADWQKARDGHGRVKWESSDDSIVCVLSSDTRIVKGAALPLDPFGAARAALAIWAQRWGQS
jgi:hypothetical protein